MPDKTMDDVSKLVSEAREAAECLEQDFNRDAVFDVCDALESVAKENAEKERSFAELLKDLDAAHEDVEKLTEWREADKDQLAAVAKERDGLRELAEQLGQMLGQEAETRAALEKLNAK